MSAENTKTKLRAQLLDGGVVAAHIKDDVKRDAAEFTAKYGIQPCLAAVRVGEDPASEVYVRNKIRACEEVGIRSEHHALPAETTSEQLLELVHTLNARDDVDGILTQLPLPKVIDETAVIEAINPLKDVDGFHPSNIGHLAMGHPTLVPCTPAGVIELLDYYKIGISGVNACIVGRSQIVGRPMAQLLLQRDATVTICHSRTLNLPEVTRQADLLIVAIGRAAFVDRSHIKPGAVVVDVGMNKLTDAALVPDYFGDQSEKRLEVLNKRGSTLIGDVKPADAWDVAGSFTPVPGGVGLLTVAMLMKNTVKAAILRRR